MPLSYINQRNICLQFKGVFQFHDFSIRGITESISIHRQDCTSHLRQHRSHK